MGRKNLLKNVMQSVPNEPPDGGRADYALRGASKSMKVSIDHLAESAKKMMEGEAIVEISPDLIDASFVSDRLDADDQAFAELKASIESGQQDTPVLLRPHPHSGGRYMTVFGHRRVRVAADLGRNVKAVVKSMDDVDHVLAQGQENTAREDLSFIEKALFAKKLLEMDQPREVIQSALTIDATLLSRMLSVSQKIPLEIIERIGAAKSVGRDRWEDLKKLIVVPDNLMKARDVVETASFQDADSDSRFELLHSDLSKTGKAPRKTRRSTTSEKRTWKANNGRVKGSISQSGKTYKLSLTASDATAFGAYLTANLDGLYQSFRSTKGEGSK